jgi:aminoglycoside 3-N-acetyltransferase
MPRMTEVGTIARTTGPPATVDSLARDLAALGVAPRGVAIVHSSLKALGYVVGGPVAVIAAIERVLGPGGTLVMPTFSSQLTDPAGWVAPPVPREWWPIIRAHEPAFDPAATPTREMGAIPELFRTLPGTRRGDHPHFSFAARGPEAAAIAGAHGLGDSLGETSPLARLYERDAQVVLLGVGHVNNSSIHLAEYRTAVPTRRRERKGGPILRDGKRVWAVYDDIEFDTGDFAALGEAFAATGPERTGRVGLANARLMRQRDLVDFAVRWMAANRRPT